MADKDLLQAISDMMDRKLEPINNRLTSLELTIENETNVGIKIIGEGHAILNRRLDEDKFLQIQGCKKG